MELGRLHNTKRLLMRAQLRPVQGDRFQPTGFADLGAARYALHDNSPMLLVESAQSVANRLENTIIGPDTQVIPDLDGLSYIRVQMKGDSDAVTTSLIEAHRINSPFIISDESFKERFLAESGYRKGAPVVWSNVAKTLFKYDVNSLLHGVFMANLEDGRLKFPRAITGFIEAKNVREVVSGGVKNNPLDPTGRLRVEVYDKDVYSNVPYSRTEFTAEEIVAYFNLDLGLLRSYDLGGDAFELLVGLALFKVRRFLGGGLRLRTSCDLMLCGDPEVTDPVGFSVADEGELLSLVQHKIQSCRGMLAGVTTIEAKVKMKRGGEEPATETAAEEDEG